MLDEHKVYPHQANLGDRTSKEITYQLIALFLLPIKVTTNYETGKPQAKRLNAILITF